MSETKLQEAYTGFAAVYDRFMDNIPYEEWTEYLRSLLLEYQIADGLVLDLGCGTGNITERLARAGYDMIGVDYSEEMLEIAQEKKVEHGQDILYLNQDMREFELYGTVAAVVSICDSMNYLESYEDLVEVLKLANNYLDPKGIFIFDMKTAHFYEKLGDATIAENREDCSFIWENQYFEEDKVNEYELTIFVREEDGRYQKFAEVHDQTAFSIEEVKEAICEAGMTFLHCYKAFTRETGNEEDDRIYFVCQEKGKE